MVAPWSRWYRWRQQRLMARRDQLESRIATASAEVARLEAQFPDAAVPDAPGFTLRGLTAAALIAEGWLCYASLSQILDDQPVPLLLSSVVAAPLAGVLMHRVGILARQGSWQGRLGWTQSFLLLICLAAPLVLGAGVVLSRVGESTGAARTVALVVGAGLQACLLLVPAVLGWLSADPVPGLAAACHRLARSRDELAVVVRKLESMARRDANFEQARAARVEECLSALGYWTAVYHCAPDGNHAVETAHVEPHHWSASPTRYLALPSGGGRA
jgi:hypothetical protein